MKLNYLALPVRDQQGSIEFYARYFGFDPSTARAKFVKLIEDDVEATVNRGPRGLWGCRVVRSQRVWRRDPAGERIHSGLANRNSDPGSAYERGKIEGCLAYMPTRPRACPGGCGTPAAYRSHSTRNSWCSVWMC
jgi:hypothetical protein